MPRRAWRSRRNEDGMQERIHGDGRWAPVQETAGISACCLRGCGLLRLARARCFRAQDRAPTVRWGRRVCGKSPGRSRTRRTGRPNPGETEPALWRRRKYLECLGASRCVRAARCERGMRYPGRSRTVPARRGRVPGRISRPAKSPGTPCEKSEWPAVLMNRGRAKAPGPSP